MAATQKGRAVAGKVILYCHVLDKNKKFISDTAEELEARGHGRVNQSAVLDRILTWARKNKTKINTLA